MKEHKRPILVAVGFAAFVGGVLALAGPTGGGPLLETFVAIASALVAIAAARWLYRSWSQAVTETFPAVEAGLAYPAPGDDVDRTIANFGPAAHGYLPDRRAVHDRLRSFAAQVYARGRDVTRDGALARIDAGECPDRAEISQFLRNPDVTLQRSRIDRFRGTVPGLESPGEGLSDFQRLYRRSVDGLLAWSEMVDRTGAAESTIVRSPTEGSGTQETESTTERTPENAPASAGEPTVRGSPRWATLVPLGVGVVALGLLLREPGLVLAGGVPFGLAVLREALPAPTPALTIDRSIQSAEESDWSDIPGPGDRVAVSVTVRNDGDRTLPDLRIVDGVPPGLPVVDGSPRLGTSLGPGGETTVTYMVAAKRGRHAFDPVLVLARGTMADRIHRERVDATQTSDTTLTCVPTLEALPRTVPVVERPGEFLGRVPASGGEGVEFYGTREYRPGDAPSRIDWNRLARSPATEPTTVEFREERAATVALVIDATRGAYVAPAAGARCAFERSICAAGQVIGSLLQSGDRVGLAAFGPTPLWLDPDTGIEHRHRAQEALAVSDAFPPTPPTADDTPHWTQWVRDFHRRYPTETQVILLSPLCDRWAPVVIRRLRSHGHPVTVISPDATVDGTVGQRLVRGEREYRIAQLREAGVRVVDWKPEDDFSIALERAATRWSA